MAADDLRSLGLEMRSGVGRSGVVSALHGDRPGRIVAEAVLPVRVKAHVLTALRFLARP